MWGSFSQNQAMIIHKDRTT
ncbi:hypothetical protein Avbf_01306 [Armadillidium vulgare]|nr:hypothetical protein Avbf_01306 [Armadillidium vulgare]